MALISQRGWRRAAWPLGIVALALALVGVCEWQRWPFKVTQHIAEKCLMFGQTGSRYLRNKFPVLWWWKKLMTSSLHNGLSLDENNIERYVVCDHMVTNESKTIFLFVSCHKSGQATKRTAAIR